MEVSLGHVKHVRIQTVRHYGGSFNSGNMLDVANVADGVTRR
jgi:hypothetical protein